MPPATRRKTGRARSLTVTIADVVVPGVTGVAGLGVEWDAVEFRDGNDPTGGRPTAPGAAAGRGRHADPPAHEGPDLRVVGARSRARAVAPTRRDVRVRFFDHHGDPVRRYRLIAAWPRRLEVTGSTLSADDGLSSCSSSPTTPASPRPERAVGVKPALRPGPADARGRDRTSVAARVVLRQKM